MRSQWVVRRMLLAIPVLFGISAITFIVIRLTPGDPVLWLVDPSAMDGVSEEYLAQLRTSLGLDRPLPIQYLLWLRELAGGNLGYSFLNGRPVTDIISERIGPTLLLMSVALFFGLAIGVPVGVVAAIRQYSPLDYTASVLSLLVISTPAFFLGLVAMYIFSLRLDLTPIGGMGTIGQPWNLFDMIHHLVLPAGILGLALVGSFARYARVSMLEVLSLDYLVTARAKGLQERTVILRHALKSALIPLISVVGVVIPILFGGAVIIERIFSWPGMGQAALTAVSQRDYPVLMGITLLVAVSVLACSILTDIAYSIVDPRIRFQ